jgi:endonuclease YncB( thermonuclease family)
MAALVLLAPFIMLAAAAASERVEGPVAATVERVVDGDTVRVLARIWVGHTVAVSVRLAGVDAPELFRPQCPAEREKAREAKRFVEQMLGGDDVILADISPDKYGGRVVARIETAAGEDVGAALLEAGLAVEAGDGDPWC